MCLSLDSAQVASQRSCTDCKYAHLLRVPHRNVPPDCLICAYSIGASFCVLCLTAILAECAATFPTAGGAYNFSTFLAPAKYRRYVGYPLGWLNYLGWLITICACCSICTGLTYSFVVLCKEDFAVTARWQLFLMYVAWAIFAWAVNIFWLPGVQILSNIGCESGYTLGFFKWLICHELQAG